MRVLAAMSGGVDSAVAAARVRDAGHEVTGVHLALSRNRQALRDGARGCCTIEDSHDARRAADMLGIPFYIWDMSERFHEDVIDDFVAEYRAGRTPNPCLRCNEKIKFAAVLDKARALGFDAVATGHYARLLDGPHGPELHRAVDPAKDQSYVLGVLDADQIAHSLFPLGEDTKPAVRAEAAERGLYVAKKPDSHDVCFIPDGDTKAYLAKTLGTASGPIVDSAGRQVGEHDGAWGYTIGQRRGLRIGDPAGDGRPRYVLDISPVSNTVTVGTAEELDVTGLSGIKLRWCGPEFTGRIECHAQLRAHGEGVPATAERTGPDSVEVVLHEAVRGLAPGQAAVLYDGTRVIGSATVATTSR
jgi:tRNA-specific 2-thiouridylase